MKKTRAEVFSINSPYGIIIRLSDLTYSWFNRSYQEPYSSTTDKMGVAAFEFKDILKDKSSVVNLKELARKNSIYGTSIDTFKEGDTEYFRMWLYNDATNPYNKQYEFDKRMNRYEKLLFEVEQIVE